MPLWKSKIHGLRLASARYRMSLPTVQTNQRLSCRGHKCAKRIRCDCRRCVLVSIFGNFETWFLRHLRVQLILGRTGKKPVDLRRHIRCADWIEARRPHLLRRQRRLLRDHRQLAKSRRTQSRTYDASSVTFRSIRRSPSLSRQPMLPQPDGTPLALAQHREARVFPCGTGQWPAGSAD